MSSAVGTRTVGGSVAAALRCASVSSRDGRIRRRPSSPAGMRVPMKQTGRALGRNRLAGDLPSASSAACAPSALPAAACRCSGSARPHCATASASTPVASRAWAASHSAYARSAARRCASRSVAGASIVLAAASIAAAHAHAVSACSAAPACCVDFSGVRAWSACVARAWAVVAALRSPCASGVPGATCASRTRKSAMTLVLSRISLLASAMTSFGGRAPIARGALVASHQAPGASSSSSSARCSMVRSPSARYAARAARSFAAIPGAMALGRRPHLVVPSLYSIR